MRRIQNPSPPQGDNKTGKYFVPIKIINETLARAGDEIDRLRAECAKLHATLSRLVFKVKAECAKGTPLHPEGHSYAIWNRHYPAEFTHARHVLESFGIRHELIEGGETFQRIWNEYREVERSAGQ